MGLEIYADETGTHYKEGKAEDARIMGIAGYIAYPDDWAKFNVEWKKVLDEFEVVSFHFYEFAGRKHCKPGTTYHGWKDDQANEFLKRLATISGTFPLFGFAALVSVKDYERKMPKFHKDLYGHPYFFCLQLFLNMVLNWMQKEILLSDTQLTLFLDDSPQFKPKVPKVWNWVKSEFDVENRMGSEPQFRKSETCLPMQSADLLIYRMRQALDNQLYRDKRGNVKLDLTQLDKYLGADGKLLVQSYSGKHLIGLIRRHVAEVLRDRLSHERAAQSRGGD